MNEFVSAASSAACSVPSRACAVRREDRLHASAGSRRPRRSGFGGDRDLVELALLVEEPLRRRQVEAGERRAAERRGRAERDEPGDLQLLHRALRLDADRVADVEVLLVGGALVDHDLVAVRPRACVEPQHVEGRLRVRDAEAEVRRAAEDDRLALRGRQLRLAVDAALDRGDTGQRRAPCRAATRSIVGANEPWPCERSNADLPLTTTFEPLRTSVKIELNALSIESVRTNVPLIIATPSTIAIAVSAVRSLRPSRPASATLIMRCARPIAARISTAGLRGSSSTIRPSARNSTRSAIVGGVRVVRDHDHRLPELLRRAAQQLEDLLPRRRVEVAGRLVGEDDRRLRDERARDRDALLLAAGELGRPVLAPVGEADALQQVLEELGLGLLAGDRERQDDVLLGGQHRQEVEELEDEADVLAAQQRHLAVGEALDLLAGDLDRAARRLVECGEQVHQRRLARARRPHDGDQLAGARRSARRRAARPRRPRPRRSGVRGPWHGRRPRWCSRERGYPLGAAQAQHVYAIFTFKR